MEIGYFSFKLTFKLRVIYFLSSFYESISKGFRRADDWIEELWIWYFGPF
jgi:hypothetical protein